MKRLAKALALLAAAALSVTLLGACSSGTQEPAAQQAIQGRSIFLDESGVVFWGYGPYICTGLLDEEGRIYDPVIEGLTTSDIYSMAVYNQDLYVASADGLFRYDLEIFQGEGTNAPLTLTEDSIDDGFEIWQDTLYYCYGTSLYSIPVDGGEETKVASEVGSFTITADGIYYVSREGGIYRLSFDGALQERLTETEEDCQFCLVGDTIFYRCEGSDQICQFSLTDGSTTVVNKPRSLSDYSYVWANDTHLVYEDSHYETFSYLRDDGTETSLHKNGVLADKAEGVFAGDILYTCNPYSGLLRSFHLATGEVNDLETEEVVQAALQAQADTTSGSSTASTGDYDILSNFRVQEDTDGMSWILSDHISLAIPSQYATQLEQYDAYSFGILYTPAWAEGFGGQLISIRAYPAGDTSYTQAPSYTLAGTADGMQYVVFFPTDVQFDTSDATQSKEYPALLDYLENIGTPDVPFQYGTLNQ